MGQTFVMMGQTNTTDKSMTINHAFLSQTEVKIAGCAWGVNFTPEFDIFRHVVLVVYPIYQNIFAVPGGFRVWIF